MISCFLGLSCFISKNHFCNSCNLRYLKLYHFFLLNTKCLNFQAMLDIKYISLIHWRSEIKWKHFLKLKHDFRNYFFVLECKLHLLRMIWITNLQLGCAFLYQLLNTESFRWKPFLGNPPPRLTTKIKLGGGSDAKSPLPERMK